MGQVQRVPKLMGQVVEVDGAAGPGVGPAASARAEPAAGLRTRTGNTELLIGGHDLGRGRSGGPARAPASDELGKRRC